MKNYSLAVYIKGWLVVTFACGLMIAIDPHVALATMLQGSRFNETPDPYFNPPKPSNSNSALKPTESNPGVLQPQRKPSNSFVQPPLASPLLPAPDIWNAPLTPVRATKPPIQSTDLATQPRIGVNNSIIRENPTPDSGNDFALAPIDSKKTFRPQSNNPVTKPEKPNSRTSGSSPFGFSKPKPSGSPKLNQVSTDSSAIGDKPGSRPTTSRDSAGESKPFEPSKVIALVGGEPIFVGDLLFDINQLLEQYMPQASEAVKEQERQKMIPQLLPKFVEQKMLFLGTLRQLPAEADVEAILEQAGKEFDDKALDKMMENSGFKSVAEFDGHLRVQGSSLRKLRRTWSIDQLTKYFLSQQLKVASEVTHQEMLDSYRESYETYAVPARSRWEQIMIRFDRTASRQEARNTLIELGDQIVYGANLAAVAKKSSHGFRADEGGQHDWTSRGALVLKELDEAIFSLEIGKLSDIIETRDGFHIVRVLERTEATHKPFLEAQVEIKERILNEKRNAAFKKHVDKLKDEIPVEYLLNEPAVLSGTQRTAQR